MTTNQLEQKSVIYRKKILQYITRAKAGHTGGSLSSTDILNVLYNDVLRVSPQDFSSMDRDRYIQSKGHCVEALYVVLADKGFFPEDDLNTMCQYKSHYIGHPTKKVKGVEQNTGALGHGLPISVGTALAGDSHSAAFGEACFEAGTAKATLGTGCSILMNIGSKPLRSENGMVTSVCWSMEGRIDFAFEGVIVTCGATIEWLKNELGLFSDSRETSAMAAMVPDNGGVYFIPAFSGLGSPHWQMDRRASISGISFGTTKNHIVRAALESIPYQIMDVIDAMEKDSGIVLKELNADGGISGNPFVVQLIADLLNKKVATIGIPDVSALGAALLAGLKIGLYESLESLKLMQTEKKYYTAVDAEKAFVGYKGWVKALREGIGDQYTHSSTTKHS